MREFAINTAVLLVALELERAVGLHPPMASAHEGYAVILEEVEELWDEVKMRKQDHERMRREAVQVAAMAMRFLIDVVKDDPAGGE